MSRPSISSRATLATLLALLAVILAASALVAAEHPANEDANAGGSGLSTFTGEWVVGASDDLEYRNQTIDLDGNLTIDAGGRLVLRNVTLVLHGEELLPQDITVSDGELVITDLDDDPDTIGDRSVVRADDDEIHYFWQVYDSGSLTLTNAWVKDCGRTYQAQGFNAGLYIAVEEVTISHVEFSMCYGGVFIDGVDITLEDCLVRDCDWVGVFIDGRASPELVRCDLEGNLVEGMLVSEGSEATLVECTVRDNRKGVLLERAFLKAFDTVFSDNKDPISKEVIDIDLPSFSSAELTRCTVTSGPGVKPVHVENSSLVSTGGDFDIDRVKLTTSVFMYKQLLTVAVTYSDSLLSPIENAEVIVKDVDDTQVTSGFTGPDGKMADIPLLVVYYNKTGPLLRTTSYNPFHVYVSFNNQDQDAAKDLRYSSGVVSFQYPDLGDPVAVDPGLREADVGVNVTLDGSFSTDNVAIEEWNWSFEELGTRVYLSGERVSYSFKEAKTYTIDLKVIDTSQRSGPQSTVSFTVSVQDRTPPTADAGPDLVVDEGDLVRFDGSNSSDNIAVVSWTWSFTYEGAPKSLTGATQTYTFNTPGTYVVVLTVEDEAGLSDTDDMQVTVLDNTPPTTTAVLDPEPGIDRKYTEVVQVVFTVSGEPAGSVELFYRVNGGSWETIAGGVALNFGEDLQYGDGTYTIEYYSQDQAGNKEDVKTIAAFTVDATDPTFDAMDPPVSPYAVSEDIYVIKGKTEPGATLTINGDPVTVGADGSFEKQVILKEGSNTYLLVATDPLGNSADLSRDIVYNEYDQDGGGGGGSNAALYAGVGIAVVVVLIIVVYFVVIRKR